LSSYSTLLWVALYFKINSVFFKFQGKARWPPGATCNCPLGAHYDSAREPRDIHFNCCGTGSQIFIQYRKLLTGAAGNFIPTYCRYWGLKPALTLKGWKGGRWLHSPSCIFPFLFQYLHGETITWKWAELQKLAIKKENAFHLKFECIFLWRLARDIPHLPTTPQHF